MGAEEPVIKTGCESVCLCVCDMFLSFFSFVVHQVLVINTQHRMCFTTNKQTGRQKNPEKPQKTPPFFLSYLSSFLSCLSTLKSMCLALLIML